MAQRKPERKEDPRDVVRLVALLVIAVFFIAFAVDNSGTVRVNFVFFHADMRLIWVILLSAALGVIADRLFVVWRRRARTPPTPPAPPPPAPPRNPRQPS